jgi:hypothetical protein
MNKTVRTARQNLFAKAFVGVLAGILAGLLMLVWALLLRWSFGLPTPSELFFDRTFPLVSVDVFIRAIVWAGGYTPLKLAGILGAFAGQILVAAVGGAIYAIYLGLIDRNGASRVSRSVIAGNHANVHQQSDRRRLDKQRHLARCSVARCAWSFEAEAGRCGTSVSRG